MTCDKAGPQVKARRQWNWVLNQADKHLFDRRRVLSHGHGILHATKGFVCTARNYNIHDTSGIFSTRIMVNLFNRDPKMKEILNSKIGNPETIESTILFKCFQLSRTSFVSFEL